MATEAPTGHYRRHRKASDLCTVTDASPSWKRSRTCNRCNVYEDRISSLPDDILIIILDKLDARTTVTTIILSKRWRNLPRRLPTCYDLTVNDMLPPRYHRLKLLNMEAKAEYEVEKNAQKLTDICAAKARHERWMAKIKPLSAILERYQRRAMRRYVKQVNAFLLAPKNVRERRSVQKLRIQTFGRGWRSSIGKWITAAIANWGVEDFELVVDGDCLSYDFKRLDQYQNVLLKQLVLSNCQPVSIWNSSTAQSLTKLTLSEGSYMGLVSDILEQCVQLTDFRITNTGYFRNAVHINVPTSKIKNLQVDRCSFWKICLTSLPCLETFTCRGRPTKLRYGEVPQLRHVSLDYSQTESDDRDDDSGTNRTYRLSKFFKRIPPLDCLILQFKGPQMWIDSLVIPSQLNHLKVLFIANVAVSWDTFWIISLLDAAPALETFNVHFDNSSEKQRIGGVCASLDTDVQQQHQYLHLKELVVAGFDGLGWQTGFVRLIMKRSPFLRRIHLLNGQVTGDGKGLGGLQIVPCRREWHECERDEVLDDLRMGFRWPPKIILE